MSSTSNNPTTLTPKRHHRPNYNSVFKRLFISHGKMECGRADETVWSVAMSRGWWVGSPVPPPPPTGSICESSSPEIHTKDTADTRPNERSNTLKQLVWERVLPWAPDYRERGARGGTHTPPCVLKYICIKTGLDDVECRKRTREERYWRCWENGIDTKKFNVGVRLSE